MNSDVRPSLFEPSVQVLRAAKRATVTLEYNTTHSAAAKGSFTIIDIYESVHSARF